MKLALLLLTVGYFHYSPLFALSVKGILPATVPYLEYAPFYDMLFLFMLMFGMVMVVTGEVQHELENTNAELAKTRDRLETMAQLDHLTSALNRHALYSLIEDERPGRRALLSGTAVVADIDDLKKINDRYGHLAGDSAIRAVASAIRACIRADDLLFRWGGDEFLVVLIGMSEADARVRLAAANTGLRERQLPAFPEPVDVSISMGFASFDSVHTLGQVIAVADEAMFKRKKKNETHP
jgi:diguanylate cyclase (GGDEF)-like protein